MNIILITLFIFSQHAFANKLSTKLPTKIDKSEVVENPTLKTLSGSLNRVSLYSSFTYKGGSLNDPLGAERPNILNAEEKASLSSMSGNLGFKYRLTKSDNFSLQVGVYSTTPFHSSHKASNQRVQREFDENHQDVDIDDPILSYFKTYYLGRVQNISFFKLQYATRGIYRDYGLRAVAAYSHASAFKINKYLYVAASLTYERYMYDKDEAIFNGRVLSLAPYQTENRLRGNLSTELYLSQSISLRFITDLFSLYEMKDSEDVEKRKLQQTVAMTYFFNRDVSIAPNIRFISEDLRSDRTNIGLSLTVNL